MQRCYTRSYMQKNSVRNKVLDKQRGLRPPEDFRWPTDGVNRADLLPPDTLRLRLDSRPAHLALRLHRVVEQVADGGYLYTISVNASAHAYNLAYSLGLNQTQLSLELATLARRHLIKVTHSPLSADDLEPLVVRVSRLRGDQFETVFFWKTQEKLEKPPQPARLRRYKRAEPVR